jgi:hypothetical protein
VAKSSVALNNVLIKNIMHCLQFGLPSTKHPYFDHLHYYFISVFTAVKIHNVDWVRRQCGVVDGHQCLPLSSAASLKMEEVCFSRTVPTYQIICRNFCYGV